MKEKDIYHQNSWASFMFLCPLSSVRSEMGTPWLFLIYFDENDILRYVSQYGHHVSQYIVILFGNIIAALFTNTGALIYNLLYKVDTYIFRSTSKPVPSTVSESKSNHPSKGNTVVENTQSQLVRLFSD